MTTNALGGHARDLGARISTDDGFRAARDEIEAFLRETQSQ